MSGDGRLTPDDMSRALGDQTGMTSLGDGGAAANPDEPGEDLGLAPAGTDELAAGPDGPTWGARIAGAVRDHKRLTAVTATCLIVLGALATGYVRTRPPPLDTRIDATVWFQPNAVDSQGVSVQNAVARSLLYLQVAAGGPALTATGLSGPGLGPGSVSQHGHDVTVSNPLDCSTIGDFSTNAKPPVLHVTRTDAWGRTVSAAIPVGDGGGTAGVMVSQVSGLVRQACVTQLGASLQLVGVRSTTSTAGAVLVLQIHNPTRSHWRILGAEVGFGPPDATLGSAPDPSKPPTPASTVAAGDTLTVSLPVTRLNCGTDLPRQPWNRSGALTLMIWPAEGPSGFGASATLALTGAQRAAALAALAAPCVDAPRLLYVITPGRPSSVGIDFTLDVTTAKGAITLGYDPDYLFLPPLNDSPPLYAPGNSGHVSMSGELTADCSSPIWQAPPQLLRAIVKVGSRFFPYRIWFNTKAVLEAESHLCGQVPDLSQARNNGWAV
ncbi:MAG TPA: hypothetical protein VIC82_07670 [Candidatus Nanopelagicales bacterium]|jgi:hypothetical protein